MKNLTALTAALVLPVTSQAKIEYVLHITCDGLRADALKAAIDLPANAAAYPGFRRLIAQGASTFQARCDFDYSETIPNHTGVITGRPVSEPAGFTPAAFSADPITDEITAPAHGLNEGDNLMLSTSGTLPGGLTATSVIYRATGITPSTFRLSTYSTATGLFTPVDITDAGSGASTFVRRVAHGFSANFPAAGESVHKLGTAPLAYKFSTFDMAHDRGLSTAIIAGKTRLNLYVDSYSASLGAADILGDDNLRNKVDFANVTNAGNAASLLVIRDAVLAQINASNLRRYSLVHFTDADTGSPGGGHTVSWNSSAWIEQGTKVVDGYLDSILSAIDASDSYKGRTAIIVTADHGGGTASGTGNSHTDASAVYNINIPLFLWGPGIPGNTDAYALFKNRTPPEPAARPNSAPGTPQPLRNTDTANIAMTLLGTPAVTGSYFRPEMEYTRVSATPGGNIVISWPLYLTGYSLQTATDVNGPWIPVAAAVTETPAQFEITRPAGEARRFWRLRAPE